MPITTVLVCGFGATGSSAVFDYLREFEGVQHLDSEFRIIEDPYGINSLEQNLVNDWTPFKSDQAIRNFRRLIQQLTSGRSVPYFGMDHEKRLGVPLRELASQYVDSLVEFKYRGMWLGINNKRLFLFRMLRKVACLAHIEKFFEQYVDKEEGAFFEDWIYFVQPEEFYTKTRLFLNEIIRHAAAAKVGTHTAVLDAGFTSLSINRVLSYFEDPRAIVVHRDPRDVYLDARRSRFRFIPKEPKSFVKWFMAIQEYYKKLPVNGKVLNVQFEDFVIDSATRKSLADFVGLTDHIYREHYFDPKISSQNVQIWMKHRAKTDTDIIERSLSEYCWS